MSNQLTRTIMENIVNKCSDVKTENEAKVNLRNKEVDIIKDIIHKGSKVNYKTEAKTNISNKRTTKKHVTLDELVNSKVGLNEEVKPSSIKENIPRKGIKTVNLDDIVPKVSLTSIGKKR